MDLWFIMPIRNEIKHITLACDNVLKVRKLNYELTRWFLCLLLILFMAY